MKIIFNKTGEFNALISQVISQTLNHEGIICDCEISVTITNNTKMQEINAQFREKNQPTDVLSFPQYEKNEIGKYNTKNNYIMLGDIILNLDKAKEQALEFNHSIEREIGFLVVHSVLHLLGYDHDNTENEEKMFTIQEEILQKMELKR